MSENNQLHLQIKEQQGVIMIPTDTNYALACYPWDELACAKVYDIKQRPVEKPLTLLVGSIEQAKKYLLLDTQEEKIFDELAEKYLPGPFNIIARSSDAVPKSKYFNPDTVSIVYNKNPAFLDFLRDFGEPLAASSANPSGMAMDELVTYGLAKKFFGDKVSKIIEQSDLTLDTSVSSTIVSIVGGSIKIVRQGDIVL